MSLVLLYKIVLCNVFKDRLLQICEASWASFLICECKGTEFWHTDQIFGEENLEKFSGISLETDVTR